jgi:hypothetical protein
MSALVVRLSGFERIGERNFAAELAGAVGVTARSGLRRRR